MESQRHHGMGFAAWVSGWSMLVGALAIVLPLYFVVGKGPALIAAGVVALLSGILAWLSTEVSKALRSDAGVSEEEPSGATSTVSR